MKIKGLTWLIVSALVLSLALWSLLALAYPDRPPTAGETAVITGFSLAVSALGYALLRRLRRRGGEGKGGGTAARLAATAALASALAAGTPVRGGEAETAGTPADGLVVACSPSVPVTEPNSSVTLRAWAEIEPGGEGEAAWRWRASSGEIVGAGSEVEWRLGADVAPGYHEAEVTLEHPSQGSGTCVAQVKVRLGTKGGAALSGRSFLDCGSEGREAQGYGLYSYLLFGARPSEAVEARYREALRAFVDLIQEIEEFQLGLPRRQINLTYLPVEGRPPEGLRATDQPSWILESYDWACAQELLAIVPGEQSGSGPFLVSARNRVAAAGAVEGPFLFQDLSAVSPHLMVLWIQEFLKQASQEEFWEPRTGPLLALRLRTALGVISEAMEPTRAALDGWESWLRWDDGPPPAPGSPER